ncbi:ribonuclease HIII [candidate division WS6 bacterium RIFOXYC1_FULL_33_9]|nr:MAG: ribonuclease HIII [candidate division WS6 bacterium RIFOXYB1_FULL_33_15]OGC37853.1 MAG: ribonuclease HIII [candidate division WS6 bacterium RIFOXYC1_FULL_33_9]
MGNQNTFTILLSKEQSAKVKDVLLANKWVEEGDSNQYVVYRLRSPRGSIALLYSSDKIVFQGKEDFTSLIANIKEKEVDMEMGSFRPHLGVDEVGKGDYFGPLVVVSCFITEEFAKNVKILGFADSKKFSDKKIMNLFNNVREYPYYYSSIVHPSEYNTLIKKYKNASLLLAKQHSKVIEIALKDLKEKNINCEYVVIDQFSTSKSRVIDELGKLGKETELIQHHKGESDIAVACASVIARGIFLEEWDKMNDRYYFNFPKGSSNVLESAKLFVSSHGEKELSTVAKVSFRTTKQVLSKS